MSIGIRPWTIQDLDNLILFANNWNVARNLKDRFPHPYTREDGKSFIDIASRNNPAQMLAIDLDGKAIGGIGIHPQKDIYRKNAELGYWLAEPYWGQGFVTKAIGKMIDYAFKHFDIDRIYACPFGTNAGSQKALLKNGFVLEGKFDNILFKDGIYYDEYIFGLRREHQGN